MKRFADNLENMYARFSQHNDLALDEVSNALETLAKLCRMLGVSEEGVRSIPRDIDIGMYDYYADAIKDFLKLSSKLNSHFSEAYGHAQLADQLVQKLEDAGWENW